MTRRSRLARLAAFALATACALAGTARLAFRDRIPVVATLVYATPPIVLGAGFTLACIMWFRRHRPRLAALALASGVACAAWWAAASHFDRPQTRRQDLRAMVWNLMRPDEDSGALAERVRELSPDIAGFVEGPRDAASTESFLLEAGPFSDWRHLGGRMVLATQGRILESNTMRLGDGSRAAIARAFVRDREVAVVLVDIKSNPFRSRREAFQGLEEILARLSDGPALVMGDFNTPRDSVHFDGWRGRLRHAFESAGEGFDATWPMPLPFLSIDHVWASSHFEIQRAQLVGSWASDHRAVVVDFSLEVKGR